MLMRVVPVVLSAACALGSVPVVAVGDDGEVALPKGLTAGEAALVAQSPLLAPRSAGAPVGSVRSVAEYEAMEGILMAYEGPSAWRAIQHAMAREITTVGDANVYMICDSQNEANTAFNAMVAAGADPSRVFTPVRRTDSIWMRDYGPRYVYEEGIRAIVDHTYNRPRPNDNLLPDFWAPLRGETQYDIPLVHGGGNYHLDSQGGGAATRLINNENPSLSAQQIIDLWRDFQGVETELFDALPAFVDSTQHIDMWMQIAGDDRIVISDWPLEPGSQWDRVCDQAAADFAANGWTVTRVPALRSGGTHYTFTNVVMVNDIVLIPEYDNVPATYSQQALNAWTAGFPDKQIIPIDCDGIVTAAGVMHCIVMHVPANSGGENPVVWVTEPSAGGAFEPGDSVSVSWKTDDDSGAGTADEIVVELVLGDGTVLDIASGLADTGSYTLTVPDVSAAEAVVRVRAIDSDGNSGEDDSSGSLTIDGGTPACSVADLAVPFGLIDIDDVDAFIGAFVAGDAAADVALPFGIVDIEDVDAFIGAFLAGCP